MPEPSVTVVVPTLAADTKLIECVQAVRNQTVEDWEMIVVDNSGRGLARHALCRLL